MLKYKTEKNKVTPNTCNTSFFKLIFLILFSSSVFLLEPDAINANPDVSNLLCFEDSTGSIDLTVSGGTFPYTYNWSNGLTTEDIGPPLSAGNYVATIMDANSCIETVSISVTQPANLIISYLQADFIIFFSA